MFTITDIKGCATLNNGVKMPYFGLGVYQISNQEVVKAIEWALACGYRLIDTASLYENEEGVGQAVRNTTIPRSEIFITTKVWNSDQGYDSTLRAFDASMKRLGLEYVDLYLIHWPVVGKYKQTWKALEKIYRDGRAKAIGVSNFLIHHLEDLASSAEIQPMVNQVEFHPLLVQKPLLEYCHNRGIQFQSWSPFMRGEVFKITLLQQLAQKYQKNVAQIVLRWNLQKGVMVIPKSANKDRIASNAQVFDFELMAEDVDKIDRLDKDYRIGAHPDNFDF
ncbi:MAG: aldo/keto reductase [Bacteroidales bacterium]|nr:aldo/keto reductase [Bacteroidales bacterium]